MFKRDPCIVQKIPGAGKFFVIYDSPIGEIGFSAQDLQRFAERKQNSLELIIRFEFPDVLELLQTKSYDKDTVKELLRKYVAKNSEVVSFTAWERLDAFMQARYPKASNVFHCDCGNTIKDIAEDNGMYGIEVSDELFKEFYNLLETITYIKHLNIRNINPDFLYALELHVKTAIAYSLANRESVYISHVTDPINALLNECNNKLEQKHWKTIVEQSKNIYHELLKCILLRSPSVAKEILVHLDKWD